MKLKLTLTCSLLCGIVTGRPSFIGVPPTQTGPRVRGNLKLYYEDGTSLTVVYDSTILDCTRTDLPDKTITKVEATSVNFVLYSKVNWQSKSKRVRWGDYTASEIGFPRNRVRSIKQPGCSHSWPFSGVAGNISLSNFAQSYLIFTWTVLFNSLLSSII